MAFLSAVICATCLSEMTRTCESNMPIQTPIVHGRLLFPFVRLSGWMRAVLSGRPLPAMFKRLFELWESHAADSKSDASLEGHAGQDHQSGVARVRSEWLRG